MLGSIGITALTLLAIQPEDEVFSSLVELCNNRVDAQAINVLKKELLYFKGVLSSLEYTYFTLNENGERVPFGALNQLARKSKHSKSDDDKKKFLLELEEKKKNSTYVQVVSAEQLILGERIDLGGLEREIVDFYANNIGLIDRYLGCINQYDTTHDTVLAFRQKIYKLTGIKPASLYYRVVDMLYDRRLHPSDLEEVRRSAQAIAKRFIVTGAMDNTVDDAAEDADGELSKSLLHVRSRLSKVRNKNTYLRSLDKLGKDISQFCTDVNVLNAIYAPKEPSTLEDYREAFERLRERGFFGLSLHAVVLFEDALSALSLLPETETTFNRLSGRDERTGSVAKAYGHVIDNILNFCKCNEYKVMEKIKEG